MSKLQTLQISLAGMALLGLLSCGGGGNKKPEPKPEPPKVASTLVYEDPTTNTGRYRFVKGAASTANTLILELLGPASDMGRGVTFGLRTESSVRFVKVNESDNEYAQNGSQFELGGAPQLFKAVLENATSSYTLRVSMAQKGTGNAKSLNGALARVALQLQPGTTITSGTPVTLTVLDGARVLPENGNSTAITSIDVGTLTAQ